MKQLSHMFQFTFDSSKGIIQDEVNNLQPPPSAKCRAMFVSRPDNPAVIPSDSDDDSMWTAWPIQVVAAFQQIRYVRQVYQLQCLGAPLSFQVLSLTLSATSTFGSML